MKKIAILGLHLGFGGVEQAICNLANMLVDDYEVELVSTYQVNEKPAFYLHPKVKVTYLTNLKPEKEAWKNSFHNKNIKDFCYYSYYNIKVLLKRTNVMKKYIQNSDADIFISSRILYHSILGKYAPSKAITIAQEHRHHNCDNRYINKLKKAITKIDYLMPVSQELTDYYQNHIDNHHTKFVYIPHAIDYFPLIPSTLTTKQIISVGRLSYEKGFIDVLKAFQEVHNHYPAWHLSIAGDGVERKKLEDYISTNHLKDCVTLHGFLEKDKLRKLYQESSLYVMGSHEESFGIVLIEAGSFGLPTIAFDSAQGAHEIIENGQNGYLIANRDISQMTKMIEKIIDDESLRQKLGNNARTNAQKYSFDIVKEQWLQFFNNMR